MGIFDKIKEPIFLKEDSTLSDQLSILEELSKKASPETAKKLEQEIRNVTSGIIGEKQIAFELKNCHMPMYILHDLYLKYDGLTAQIDYLVITRRRTFVIECKNLYGNIEITEQGDFIRNINYNGKFFKERIYSPITQNQRHLDLIKQIRLAERTNPLSKMLFEKNFSSNYRSVIVLANPKTILNQKYAKKEIKDQVIPVDRLISYIKQVNSEKDTVDSSEKDMTDLAHFFLKISQTPPDYVQKYLESDEKENTAEQLTDIQLVEVQAGEPNKVTPSPDAAGPVAGPVLDAEPAIAVTAEAAVEPIQILCPKCGAVMVLRTASKGNNAGNSFYGCSRFPKCRGIISIK